MGIAADVLALRQNQFSSVITLVSALQRLREASAENRAVREFQVYDAADVALTNIAAHTGEAMVAFQSGGRTERANLIRRRSRRRKPFVPTALQRPLFAARTLLR